MSEQERYSASVVEAAYAARRLGVSAGDLFARAIERGGIVDFSNTEGKPEFEQIGENLYVERTTRVFTVAVTEKRVRSAKELRERNVL